MLLLADQQMVDGHKAALAGLFCLCERCLKQLQGTPLLVQLYLQLLHVQHHQEVIESARYRRLHLSSSVVKLKRDPGQVTRHNFGLL
jgi:hypothetical protein